MFEAHAGRSCRGGADGATQHRSGAPLLLPAPRYRDEAVGRVASSGLTSAHVRFFPITARTIGRISYRVPMPDVTAGSFAVKA